MRGFLHVQICFNISIDLKTIKKHRKNERREKGGWKKFVPEMFDIISYNCLLEIEKYSVQIHTFIKENLFWPLKFKFNVRKCSVYSLRRLTGFNS